MLKLNLATGAESIQQAVLKSLGFPPATKLELDMDKVYIQGNEVILDDGFIKSLSMEVLVSEIDGVHDDPEVYFTEDELFKSFTKWTGCPREEYESGQYDDEHNDGLIVRLYTIPVIGEEAQS